MRRYGAIALAVVATLLAVFVSVGALDIVLLEQPDRSLDGMNAGAAFVGVALLVADAVLPVASSVVMVAHGALFGVVAGTVLSVVGGTGATLVGLAIGRCGGPAIDRVVRPGERLRAERLLERWGTTAIVATRPVPLLAEAVAILAGASGLSWARATLGAMLGSLPPALVYAVAGRSAREAGVSAPLLVVALAGSAAIASMLPRRREEGA